MSDRQPDAARFHMAGINGQEADFNKELGRRVSRARRAANLTQEQLARELGVARGSIANLERGMQAPSAYKLARIAAGLGCSPQSLIPPLNTTVAPIRHDLSLSQQSAVRRTLQLAAKKQTKSRP